MFNLNRTPYFELKGLESDIGYDIIIFASNDKGRSDSTYQQIYTLNNAEKHTGMFSWFFFFFVLIIEMDFN